MERSGSYTGLKYAEIEIIHKDNSNDCVQCCHEVIAKWIARNGHVKYPVAWKGICDLLNDLEYYHVEHILKEVLEIQGINMNQ